VLYKRHRLDIWDAMVTDYDILYGFDSASRPILEYTIKTEINGFPCYIYVECVNDFYADIYWQDYIVLQDIGNNTYIEIEIGYRSYEKLETSEDAHIKYVTPYILTQDQIQ